MSPRRMAAALVAAALSAALPALVRAQDEAPRKALKVCQDPNNLPFSNTAGDGIENKLAELFGKALGLPVQYYEFPQRMAFVRNTLRYKLPGEDFRCDLMMGVPVGFDQVSVTKPYYRSTYALVFPASKGLDGVKSTSDFLALGQERLGRLRIGVFDRSPASDWLARHGLTDQGVPYKMLDADPARYPGQILEDELAQGRIDAAIVWGPLAGFFAQRLKQPQLVVIPMASEPGVRFDYQMAMGVRHGEKAWKDQIEALIESRRPEIRAILQAYNVPLLDDTPAAPLTLSPSTPPPMPLTFNRMAATSLALAGLIALSPALAQGTPAGPATENTSASQNDKKDFSAAERLLLMSDQLKGLKAGSTLTYRYQHQGEGDEAFEDRAKLMIAKRKDGSCCTAGGEFLSGARKLSLPEVEQPVGNPVLLYFLERDIRQMNKITKGSASYFRKRIRMALYEAATLRDVQASYKGKPVAAREIILTPYVNDPNEARFPQYVQRSYRFVLSEAVPGQVVSLQTLTPGAKPDAAPLTDDQLTLEGASVPALQAFAPVAIRTVQ